MALKAVKYEEKYGNDSILFSVEFDKTECVEAERGGLKALEIIGTKENSFKEKMLMYFFQANSDEPRSYGRTGLKACIYSISNEPLTVYILSDIDKQRIKNVFDNKSNNPLHIGFVVDVNVEYDRNNNPKIYRVSNIFDIIDSNSN